jgi:hypothetical protein
MGQEKIKSIMINNEEYVLKSLLSEMAEKLDGLEYVIVRTYSAGVFSGYLKIKNGSEVTLVNARRLWQWYGAASLSQLSVDGVSKPDQCKFPCEVKSISLLEAIEICPCTEKARLSIQGVKVWSA